MEDDPSLVPFGFVRKGCCIVYCILRSPLGCGPVLYYCNIHRIHVLSRKIDMYSLTHLKNHQPRVCRDVLEKSHPETYTQLPRISKNGIVGETGSGFTLLETETPERT